MYALWFQIGLELSFQGQGFDGVHTNVLKITLRSISYTNLQPNVASPRAAVIVQVVAQLKTFYLNPKEDKLEDRLDEITQARCVDVADYGKQRRKFKCIHYFLTARS